MMMTQDPFVCETIFADNGPVFLWILILVTKCVSFPRFNEFYPALLKYKPVETRIGLVSCFCPLHKPLTFLTLAYYLRR